MKSARYTAGAFRLNKEVKVKRDKKGGLMDKKNAIYNYLRIYHIGRRNAVHSKELEDLFELDGRNIRRKISALRQDGFPI